jgi:hypothetical protein
VLGTLPRVTGSRLRKAAVVPATQAGLRLGDAASGVRVPVPPAEYDGGGRAEGPSSGRRSVPRTSPESWVRESYSLESPVVGRPWVEPPF